MENWLMFFLGTLAYFLWKVINRRKKTVKLSFSFWLKDNGPELLLSFIVDFAMAFAFLDEAANFDFSKISWIPDWLPEGLVIKLGAFFLGYGGGLVVYKLLQKKAKYAKNGG